MIYQNRAWLFYKYWICEKSMVQIAKEVNKDKMTILYWLKKLKISRRTISDAIKIRREKNKELWENEHSSTWRGGVNRRYARKRWLEETNIKIPNNFDVHHIDGNRKNNHIDNLVLVSHKGHMRWHRLFDKAKGKKFFGHGMEVEG